MRVPITREQLLSHVLSFLVAAMIVVAIPAFFLTLYPDEMTLMQRRLEEAERTGQCIEIRRDNGTPQGLIERYCPSYPTVTPIR